MAEVADDGGDVALVGVDLGVEVAHVGGGEFSGEIGEGGAELREFLNRGLADDGDGVIGREVVMVVFEGDEMEGVDEAVGGVAGDDVGLMANEAAIEEAEVHDSGGFGEMEIVTFDKAGETVGAFEKFVADSGAPFRGDSNDVGEFLEMEGLCVIGANDHGEGVFEAERFGDFEMEAVGVATFDAVVDGGRFELRRFV